MLEYIAAKDFKPKLKPYSVEAKATFPKIGDI
jgi:hypothetical protein